MPDDIVLRSTPEDKTAKHLPNPKGISPKADTENPDVAPTQVKMDISNPPAMFSEHPMHEHFSRNAPRKHFGAGIHKSQIPEEQ